MTICKLLKDKIINLLILFLKILKNLKMILKTNRLVIQLKDFLSTNSFHINNCKINKIYLQ